MDIDENLTQAMDEIHRGALAAAETRCRSILALAPQNAMALALLGDVLTRRGRMLEAAGYYERAIAIRPDNARLFSAAAMLRFRAHFGSPARPRPPAPGRKRVQMHALGSAGRFGNQLLQYGFVKLYAAAHDLSAEFPDWIGRDLFDLDDPLPSGELPTIDENDANLFASLNGASGRVYAECDISGYFCGDTGRWGGRCDAFRTLFKPGRHVAPLLDSVLGQLRAAGKTLVAIHLRHSDFGYGPFWIAPPSWYRSWLEALWPALDDPVLYVASENGKFVEEFAAFSPWHAGLVGVDIPGAGFLLDHHVLRHADQLAIANSTFSFSAAMLNATAQGFARPDPDRRALVAFDPWSAPVLLVPTIETSATTETERIAIQRLFDGGDSVLHVGCYCAPWTHLARATRPGMMVHEADGDVALDRWCEANAMAHLRHLVIEDAQRLAEILAGAPHVLSHARIGMIHFRVSAAPVAAPHAFAAYRYAVFRLDAAAPAPVVAGASLVTGRYVAIHDSILRAKTAR